MAIDDKIRDEKLKFDINRWTLSFGKINKNEYLRSKEILPSDQRRVIKQAKFAYSTLGKALQKQAKTIQDQGKKNK